jgi:hypothetical protein
VAVAASGAAPSPRLTEPPVLQFYPQAGILWQDLYFGNFVDLDPGPGVLDWNCGTQTYDTHTGEDSLIRSFQEQRIGVPVFAAVDGKVVDVSDRLPDEHTADTMTAVDNHVIISSYGAQLHTVYGHLRRYILVKPGERVVAGQQLGYTASSGHSSWPHLHFTVKLGLDIWEPFAGPCRPGKSYWASQPAMPTRPYVRDFTFSPEPFGARKDPPWDEAKRTGTYVAGERDVYFRTEFAFFDGSAVRVRFIRPDSSVVVDEPSPVALQGGRATWADWHRHLNLDQVGGWRLQLWVGGRTLVDAPFDVVASASQVGNRGPNAVSVSLLPDHPSRQDVLQCVVHTSLVAEDPDYAIMLYRYRWFVAGKRVRSITSAALSDVLRHRLAKRGQRVRCRVTPSDGTLVGPTASAAAPVG